VEKHTHATDAEKRRLDSKLEAARAELDGVLSQIRESQQADAERIRSLKDDEETLLIKSRALKQERESFEIEKHQFLAGHRI